MLGLTVSEQGRRERKTLRSGINLKHVYVVDWRTVQREYDFFPNVLVEIDLLNCVQDTISIKEEGAANFFKQLKYQNYQNSVTMEKN